MTLRLWPGSGGPASFAAPTAAAGDTLILMTDASPTSAPGWTFLGFTPDNYRVFTRTATADASDDFTWTVGTGAAARGLFVAYRHVRVATFLVETDTTMHTAGPTTATRTSETGHVASSPDPLLVVLAIIHQDSTGATITTPAGATTRGFGHANSPADSEAALDLPVLGVTIPQVTVSFATSGGAAYPVLALLALNGY